MRESDVKRARLTPSPEEEADKQVHMFVSGEWCGQLDLRDGRHDYSATRIGTGERYGRRIDSVTTTIHKMFPPFVGERMAQRVKPGGKYGSMPPAAIMQHWDANRDYAADMGTAMHGHVEAYLREVMAHEGRYSEAAIPSEFPRLERAPVAGASEELLMEGSWQTRGVVAVPEMIRELSALLQQRELVPVAVEKGLFSADMALAGTLDALFRAPDGTVHLYDWKRRPKFTTIAAGWRDRYAKFGWRDTPARGMPDSHEAAALFQLNVYRRMLHDADKIEVSEMHIVTLYPGHRLIDSPIRTDDALMDRFVEWRVNALQPLPPH